MIYITDSEIERFIKEDVPYGDLTTRSVGLSSQPVIMEFRSGADMTVSSSEEAARLLVRLGCVAEVLTASGTQLNKGQLLLTAKGAADAMLAGWKAAQTLVEFASGIATSAARIVAAAKTVNPNIVIACTRKNFPGAKAISVKAILAGGAVPHRLGLSDTLLLFPEHLALLNGLPMAQAIARLKAACPEKKIVVEVADLNGVKEALSATVDVIQLEKFSPDDVAKAVEMATGTQVRIAAAGGVNAANAADYAKAGVSILVTSAPYSAPPVDVKVAIGPK